MPPHILPCLPPNHRCHLLPGYFYPDNLSPGHPGEAYPGMPDYPVVHPGSWRGDWYKYVGILDAWPPSEWDDKE